MEIITVRGTELSELLRELRAIVAESGASVHTLRVAIDVDGVKLKANESVWSRGYGQQGA